MTSVRVFALHFRIPVPLFVILFAALSCLHIAVLRADDTTTDTSPEAAGDSPAAEPGSDTSDSDGTARPYTPGSLARATPKAPRFTDTARCTSIRRWGRAGRGDFHRFVFGFNYDFTDRIRFGSEVEIEHSFLAGGTTAGGEVELEQAWIQFDLVRDDSSSFSLSATGGVLLVPFGRMNLWHEPTEFFSVERPNVNSRIIPTTWFEPGIEVSGTATSGVTYILGVYAGLQGEGVSNNGIRGGRQKGNSGRFTSGLDGASLAALNIAGRVDWESAFGLTIGGSFFASRLDHPGDVLPPNSWAFGWAADLIFVPPVEGLDSLRLSITFAFEYLDKAGGMSAALGDSIAKHILGYSVELAWNAFRLWSDTSTKLWVFCRFELYDTQHKMPGGVAPNLARDRTAVTFGLAFFPIASVVLKVDFTDNQNLLGEGGDVLSFGIGFQY